MTLAENKYEIAWSMCANSIAAYTGESNGCSRIMVERIRRQISKSNHNIATLEAIHSQTNPYFCLSNQTRSDVRQSVTFQQACEHQYLNPPVISCGGHAWDILVLIYQDEEGILLV